MHPDGGVAKLRLLTILEKAGVDFAIEHDLDRVLESGSGPYSALLNLLTHLELDEAEASRHWQAIDRHREALSCRMGRDPGVSVAALDYFQNIQHRLHQPTIIEREELAATEHSAMVDPLTGLFNRGFFKSSLEREVERTQRYRDRFSLVIFDLDDFKQINDRYGHLAGDDALVRVSSIIRRNLRQVDVPCRFGGEEFALILPGTGRTGAFALAERIRVEARREFRTHRYRGRTAKLTLSGGVATCPADAGSSGELTARADRALYRAKRSGKDRIALCRTTSFAPADDEPRRPAGPTVHDLLDDVLV